MSKETKTLLRGRRAQRAIMEDPRRIAEEEGLFASREGGAPPAADDERAHAEEDGWGHYLRGNQTSRCISFARSVERACC